MHKLLLLIKTLEDEVHHAGLLTKPARLEALLHSDFFETGKSGIPYSRQQVINFLSGLKEPLPACSDNHKLYQLSSSSVLLTYRSIHHSGNENIEVLRSSVWLLTEIGWQLFYHQGTIKN